MIVFDILDRIHTVQSMVSDALNQSYFHICNTLLAILSIEVKEGIEISFPVLIRTKFDDLNLIFPVVSEIFSILLG